MPDNLAQEAAAFDRQIIERTQNGHLPDLRRATSCHYFLNNSWREPEYVGIDFCEQFDLVQQTLRAQFAEHDGPIRVLEVGCGPGYFSLELARVGFDVTGIDVSPQCIRVAEEVAREDPWKATRGPLQYHCMNFLADEILSKGPYSAVLFVGALHHFRDQSIVMAKVGALLEPNGCILAHEPTRDRFAEPTAVLVHLIRVLLSVGGGFYDSEPVPRSRAEHDKAIERLFADLRYEDADGCKKQSANDNDAGYATMMAALDEHFERVVFKDRYAFFHEIIGGLRFSRDINVTLAKYLRDVDARLCEGGIIAATEFFFAGRRRGGAMPHNGLKA